MKEAQERAERLVRQWQKDCQPMADPADLQELEKRVAAELANHNQQFNAGEAEMTKDEAIKELQEWAKIGHGDPEAAHANANNVLCAFLKGLGHGDVVEAWQQVPKWYA